MKPRPFKSAASRCERLNSGGAQAREHIRFGLAVEDPARSQQSQSDVNRASYNNFSLITHNLFLPAPQIHSPRAAAFQKLFLPMNSIVRKDRGKDVFSNAPVRMKLRYRLSQAEEPWFQVTTSETQGST
jgi:hypothetical protein